MKKQQKYGVKLSCLNRMVERLVKESGKDVQGMSLPEKVRAIGSSAKTKDEAWRWSVEKWIELADSGINPLYGNKGKAITKKVAVAAKKAERSLGQRRPVRYQKYIPGEVFYASREWKEVRYEALKMSDGRCCLCGRSHRDNGVVMHVDHIKPRSVFPELQLEVTNLQVLCEPCNIGKSNYCDKDWR